MATYEPVGDRGEQTTAENGMIEATIGNAFPVDDPVARFIVVMAMARNDVRHAMLAASPATQGEFMYYIRLSYGHLTEGVEALKRWRQRSPEVQQFLRELPAKVSKQRREAEACLQKVSNKGVQRARHRTFHYPSPDPRYQPDSDSELKRVLSGLATMGVDIQTSPDNPRDLRFLFADKIELMLAFGREDTVERVEAELKTVRDASIAFVQFVESAVLVYLTERGWANLLPPEVVTP